MVGHGCRCGRRGLDWVGDRSGLMAGLQVYEDPDVDVGGMWLVESYMNRRQVPCGCRHGSHCW